MAPVTTWPAASRRASRCAGSILVLLTLGVLTALFSALGASPWPTPISAGVAVAVALAFDASVAGPEVAVGCPPRAMRSSSAHTGTDGKGWLRSSRAFLP